MTPNNCWHTKSVECDIFATMPYNSTLRCIAQDKAGELKGQAKEHADQAQKESKGAHPFLLYIENLALAFSAS